MKKQKTFKELVKLKNLTDDNYPYSEKGIRYRKFIKMLTTFFIILAIIFHLVVFGANRLNRYYETKNNKYDTVISLDGQAPNTQDDDTFAAFDIEKIIDDFMDSINNGLKSFSSHFANRKFFDNQTKPYVLSYIGVYIFIWLLYLINYIKRNRLYERNVFKNDGLSIKYTNQMKTYLDVKSRQKKAQEAVSKDGSTSQDEHKLNALVKLSNLKLRVNTRQSDFDTTVRTQYRIIIELPNFIDERNVLLGEVKDLQMSATYILSGNVKFGSFILDEAGKTITWRAVITEQDEYKMQDNVVITNEVPSETTVPLELFIDRSEEIKEKKEKALDWSKKTGEVIDKILSTKQEQVTSSSIVPGNKNTKYVYDLSFSVNVNQFSNYEELFDKTFKTKGSMVGISMGKLEITIPLPKDCETPIDTKTMIKSVFG